MNIDRRLHEQTKAAHGVRLRRARVTATSPLTVKIGGADATVAPQGRLATYTSPSVNDEVLCLQQGRTLFVLGKFT